MVISVFSHLYPICKSSLWQREGLPVQYFSTYWVLIESKEKERKIGRENWEKIVVIVFIFTHATVESVEPQTMRRKSQCKNTRASLVLLKTLMVLLNHIRFLQCHLGKVFREALMIFLQHINIRNKH